MPPARLVSLLVSAGATGAGLALRLDPIALPGAIAVGALAGRTWTGRRLAAAVAACAVALALGFRLQGGGAGPLDDAAFALVVVGAPALAARALRARSVQLGELRDRTARLEAGMGTAAAAARAEERARLAGDVHRAMAQRVGEIALLAAGADRAADADPARARQALSDMEATAREALSELREVIGVLRRADGAASR